MSNVSTWKVALFIIIIIIIIPNIVIKYISLFLESMVWSVAELIMQIVIVVFVNAFQHGLVHHVIVHLQNQIALPQTRKIPILVKFAQVMALVIAINVNVTVHTLESFVKFPLEMKLKVHFVYFMNLVCNVLLTESWAKNV